MKAKERQDLIVQEFVDLHGNDYQYDPLRKEWLKWNGLFWEETERKKWPYYPDLLEIFRKHSTCSSDLTAVKIALKRHPSLTFSDWNSNLNFVQCDNATVEIPSLQIILPEQSLRLKSTIKRNFDKENHAFPIWEAMLEKYFGRVMGGAEYVQACYGYAFSHGAPEWFMKNSLLRRVPREASLEDRNTNLLLELKISDQEENKRFATWIILGIKKFREQGINSAISKPMHKILLNLEREWVI